MYEIPYSPFYHFSQSWNYKTHPIENVLSWCSQHLFSVATSIFFQDKFMITDFVHIYSSIDFILTLLLSSTERRMMSQVYNLVVTDRVCPIRNQIFGIMQIWFWKANWTRFFLIFLPNAIFQSQNPGFGYLDPPLMQYLAVNYSTLVCTL